MGSQDVFIPYKLVHQNLCIKSINFETESLMGYVELIIEPLRPDITQIRLNSKQCCIYHISINDNWTAEFDYDDPTLQICENDCKFRNLDYFESCHLAAINAVDGTLGRGELTVMLPPAILSAVSDLKTFRVFVEFSMEKPKGGIKFVVPDVDGTMLDRGAHMFTYGYESSSRLWFPCIDNYAEVCTWKLEFTVEMYMTAVSCGDLLDTVYTADLRKKTYHYYVSVPTSASNIALAVGPFEILVDPTMHEVTHFCLPHLLPILKSTTGFLHQAFEFYEELLSSRYPYSCYKQVFVDQAAEEFHAYSTISIFSTNLLHSKRVIDQAPLSQAIMAQAVAQQFFGCFIGMRTWNDAWLIKGISGYLSSLFRKKLFGNNEYRYFIRQESREVVEYERSNGPIVLDPSQMGAKENTHYFSTRHPHLISPTYASMLDKKAHLVIRLLQFRIGMELLVQVLNKLLALATGASVQKCSAATAAGMVLSTIAFQRRILAIAGKDIGSFLDQWVYNGGHIVIYASFVFNRKRNVVELEVRQEVSVKGSCKYRGPLTVTIQELDGTFNHLFKVEDNRCKFEILCHSKSRRLKKKKIPLCTLEEVDMDLNDSDPDSPVLWLRIDPDLSLLRVVHFEQPDWMWQYMLRFERCVIAQFDAIDALEQFPSPKTRLALTDTIENDKCFYRVRIAAAHCLTKVANSMTSQWAGPPAMLNIFRKMFGSHSCPNIVRVNNFSNLQRYFIQKAIPLAMARLRTSLNICPSDVLHFILDIIKYNDNSKNKFTDSYYHAALIDALAETVAPAVTAVTISGLGPSTDALTPETRSILDEISCSLNMEKLLPTYRLSVTVSCLKAIRRLQKCGHLPTDASIFKSYALPGNFVDVRLAALESLVDYTKVEGDASIFSSLLDTVETDADPYVKYCLLAMLTANPPFTRKDSNPLNNEELVERLWKLMNSGCCEDSRLRCGVVDLYHTLYGRTRPSCLHIPESMVVFNLKERKTLTNPSLAPEEGEEYNYVNVDDRFDRRDDRYDRRDDRYDRRDSNLSPENANDSFRYDGYSSQLSFPARTEVDDALRHYDTYEGDPAYHTPDVSVKSRTAYGEDADELETVCSLNDRNMDDVEEQMQEGDIDVEDTSWLRHADADDILVQQQNMAASQWAMGRNLQEDGGHKSKKRKKNKHKHKHKVRDDYEHSPEDTTRLSEPSSPEYNI